MRARNIEVSKATGWVLGSPIFRAGGKKLLAKGHVISEDDAKMLQTEGLNQVWVTELEEGEIGEDDAVMQVASDIGRGSVEVRLATGGRANLFATQLCCLFVDVELLRQVNTAGCIVIATSPNFSYAQPGQRVAVVKSRPFAVMQPQLEALMTIVKERGPILQARHIHPSSVAVLYSDPTAGERARELFENIMRLRLERLGVSATSVLSSHEDEGALSKALLHLLRVQPSCILVASTTAPAGPDDAVGRAMIKAGCSIERFLAPVEPGSLLLLGYRDKIPVVSAPGCFRSAKPNVVDLILPPLLARYRITGAEIASLGHGGLLA